MKCFKVLIIILSLFLVGCNKEEENIDTIYYNLNINTVFEEKITVFLNKNAYQLAKENQEQEESVTNLEYKLLYEDINPIFSNQDEFYQKNINKRFNNIRVDLSYNYIENDFIYSNYLMNCFENYDIVSNEDSLEIHLSGEFYCLNDKKNVDIRVSSIFDVDSTNGILEDNFYVWNITEENVNDVYIEHVLLRNYEGMISDKENIENNKESSNGINLVKIVILVLLLVGLFILKRRNQSNY